MDKKEFFKSLSFKKVSMVFGFVVFLTAIVFGIYKLSNFLNLSNLASKPIIKNFTVHQFPSVPGETIKWVKTISINQINSLEHLLSIPSIAKSIKIGTTTQNKIEEQKTPSSKLTNADRKKLFELSTQASQSEASLVLAEQIKKQKAKGFFASISRIISKVGSMFATVADAEDLSGISTSDVILLDLTASSSPIAEQVAIISEQLVATSTETSVSTSTEVLTTEATPTTEFSTTTEATSTEVFTSSQDRLINSIEDVSTTSEITSTEVSTTTESTLTEMTATTTDAIQVVESELATRQASTTEYLTTTTPTELAMESAFSTDLVSVEYETPAPTISEATTDTGKIVSVSAPEGDIPVTNVLAYTNIPEIYKVGQEDKIKIKWQNNGDQNVEFHTYDLNGNGKLDYVEWTVPHLSTQTFEIIFISKAFQLDGDKNIIADIYDQVSVQDGTFATVSDGEYVRVTFYKTLTNKNDNTIFAKPTNSGQPVIIEVYPVYTDADGNQTEGSKVATFENIDHEAQYKILLTGLGESTNVFDLKVTGGSIDVDYIVDPTPVTVTDSFNDSTNISTSTQVTIDTGAGQLSLSVASSWTCGNTFVDERDSKTYTTVYIATSSQCWMSQNLNVGTKIPSCVNGYIGVCTTGSSTPSIQGTSTTNIQKYCYSDNEANCDLYGGLYERDQAMGGSLVAGVRGICPAGWHLPTDAEYKSLEMALGMSQVEADGTGWRGTHSEGDQLKKIVTPNKCFGATPPCGISGWQGLLAGYRDTNGAFYDVGSGAYFWSSLVSGSSAWRRDLNSGHATVYRTTYAKADGFSVRCLKD